MYCKGIETATKLIIGPCGSVVQLRFARVESGQRVSYTVALVRELRATRDPSFRISQHNSRTTTKQVYLTGGSDDDSEESQPNSRGKKSEPEQSNASPQSNSHNTSTAVAVEGRQILYKGNWYTEAQVAAMEAAAKALKDKILAMEMAVLQQHSKEQRLNSPKKKSSLSSETNITEEELIAMRSNVEADSSADPGARELRVHVHHSLTVHSIG